jgi:hypothetical protein
MAKVGAAILIGTTLGVSAPVGGAPKPKPAATPRILITASPNPLVETGTSNVDTIVQVEANPSYAGDDVTISSTQLSIRCAGGITFYTTALAISPDAITLTLDNDGNALVYLWGSGCAPGSALLDASLDAPPFATAITSLRLEPPQVTAPGLHADPQKLVEVGDGSPTSSNDQSEAMFVFYVETNPVYAEQTVSITSDQLSERCGLFSAWYSGAFVLLATNAGFAPSAGLIATQPGGIDNDGNAVFVFDGGSCAAGTSVVIADVTGGATYSTQAVILPPAVTI